MKNVLRFLIVLALLPVAAGAWPFPSLPQCGPIGRCEDEACYVPSSEKCAQVVQDMIDNGTAAPCDNGAGGGACAV